MDNYLYEDDIIIKSEIIISIFKNIKKITDSEFLNHFDNTLKKYLETNFSQENISFRDRVFFSVIEEIAKNFIEEKFYLTLIKNFIKQFIMINDVFRDSKDSQFFKNSTKIYEKLFQNLEHIDTVFKIHNDQNFMTDFINYLIKVIFDINTPTQPTSWLPNDGSSNISTTRKNSKDALTDNLKRRSNEKLINLNNKDGGGSNNLSKILNFYLKCLQGNSTLCI